MVEALQHEQKELARAESDVERLINHIKESEKNLVILNDLETSFIKGLSIETQV